jgi:hypothetical protein
MLIALRPLASSKNKPETASGRSFGSPARLENILGTAVALTSSPQEQHRVARLDKSLF